nr:RNA-directed DNA polymerase, eukaryota, reverse transcriptase zinc-binding domain protein [Tanacetum cinerariifolium]
MGFEPWVMEKREREIVLILHFGNVIWVAKAISEQHHSNENEKEEKKRIHGEPQSENPFNIYDLLYKKKDTKLESSTAEDSLKYPLGFTPENDKLLWEYLILAINNWKGEVVIMGDFNEVHSPNEKYGSVFNLQGADAFNRFISSAGSEEIPLEGCKFTWCHKSGAKMSKLDRFLVSEGLWNTYPDLTSVSLDRFCPTTGQFLCSWKNAPICDPNAMRLKEDLAHVDVLIDNGEGDSDIFFKRRDLFKSLHDLDKLHSLELAHKTKIKWVIKGDENSKYYHESEFLSYFTNSFDRPPDYQLHVTTEFPRKLSPDQQSDLEIDITQSEIKKVVWECEVDKSPGPDGFTFGTNSSFITLILKNQEAKTTKDFHPITLIGSVYKIITKILVNRMVVVLEDLVNEVQSAFVSKRQILDGPFILNELYQWCTKKKKQTMIFKGSILVNGSPTLEFQFRRGLKKGDPLSLFLFILIMESLHISVDRVVEAILFRGIQVGNTLHISHLFFADDVVFLGHWSDSNIDTILHILDCFYHASGLKINMSKRKLMGISVHRDNVAKAAQKIGCDILQIPFSYLGSKVGSLMSRIQSWNETINHIATHLSRWKMQTLSIRGRFTLIKSVLGSLPIYQMSLFRVPLQVLHKMESIRGHFSNGIAQSETKQTWIKWKNVLASTQNGGLGVSSLFALNRALLFKWVWRFHTHQSYLWTKVIKGIHGNDGNLGKKVRKHHPSFWFDIIKEVNLLCHRGIDLMSFLHRKMGNGEDTYFWDDKWGGGGDKSLKVSFPRIYALKTHNLITVAHKFSHSDLSTSFRRMPRSGIEEAQYNQFKTVVLGVSLIDAKDSCRWSLEGSGEFYVSSTRKFIDDHMLAMVSSKTRWIKEVPIKVNILAWKVKINGLPTRLNISKRGIDIDSILCPLCEKHVESSSHTFFSCHISREIFRKVLRWWQIDDTEISCYEEWLHWLLNIRLSSNHKKLLEGVCYVLWWHVWQFRNKTIFGPSRPLKAVLFDEVIASSFYWYAAATDSVPVTATRGTGQRELFKLTEFPNQTFIDTPTSAYATYRYGTSPHQEYLLEFTSEYGISEALHPELPGPEDRIVDFPKEKDGMPAENTYSPEAVMILNTHRTPIQKQPKALLCLVGLSRRYYLRDEVHPTFFHDDDRGNRIEDPAAATDSSGVPSTIERSPLDFANENPSQPSTGPEDQEAAAPEVPPLENVTTTRVAPEVGQAEGVATTELGMGSTGLVPTSQGAPVDVSDPDPLSFADPLSRPSADVA